MKLYLALDFEAYILEIILLMNSSSNLHLGVISGLRLNLYFPWPRKLYRWRGLENLEAAILTATSRGIMESTVNIRLYGFAGCHSESSSSFKNHSN